MGKTAVVYKSKYGSSKQYAKWIGGALDADIIELGPKTLEALAQYSTVIYGGALYAGSVNGMARFKRIFKRYKDKHLVMFVVGMSPADAKNSLNRAAKSFAPEMHAKVKLFYFRGAIDYSKLSLPHRLMMAGLVRVLRLKKHGDLSEGERQIVSSYGKAVSFLDEAAIEPLLTYVCSLGDD